MHKDELNRLLNGPGSLSPPSGSWTDKYAVTCAGNADAVLRNAKQILEIVLRNSSDDMPEVDWFSILPKWFVDACAPELTAAEIDQLDKYWRSLSYEEKLH